MVVVVTGKDMEEVPFQLAVTHIPRGTTGCDWTLQESRVETGHCNTALQKREGAYEYVGPWGQGIIAMEYTDGRKAILFTPTADVGSCLVTTRELHISPKAFQGPFLAAAQPA